MFINKGYCTRPFIPRGLITYVCDGRFPDLTLEKRPSHLRVTEAVALEWLFLSFLVFTVAGTVPDSHRIPFYVSNGKLPTSP